MNSVQPHPEWRIIVETLYDREYGSKISHEELSVLTRLPYPSTRYFGQVAKARKHLRREWRREMETVNGQGYRLVRPDEFNQRGRRQVGFAGRRLREAREVFAAAPQELLTDDQNARNADALAKVGALEAQRRRVLSSTRPSLPPPKIDVPKLLTS